MIAEDALAIGLGGNVGGEAAILARFVRAREALAQLGEVRSAPLYRTAPIGPLQEDFLNTVVRVKLADATPAEILHTIGELEKLLGRVRDGVRDGPREIDLDVLLWGTRVIRTPELEIPHPRLGARRFVVQPLAELFGSELVVPGLGATLGELLVRAASQRVEEIASTW